MDDPILKAYESVNDGFDVPDNFGGLPCEYASPQFAKFAVVPVPFEGTVSYSSGTASGPAAVIEASQHVELYDAQTGLSPFIYGIQTCEPVTSDSVEQLLELLEHKTANLLNENKIPIIIGGEHSVSFAPIRAVAQRSKIGILQIDAHSDLRNEYDGNPHSHACVMRRSIELENVVHLSQAGIRAVSFYEVEQLKRDDVTTEFAFSLSPDWIDRLIAPLPERVYVTIDVDGLDPSIMPATGTPEPGGLSWNQVISLLDAVCTRRKVVAFDVVELAPIEGLHHPEFTTALLIYKMMAFLSRT